MKFGAVSVALGPTLDAGQVYTRRATDHILEEGEVQLSLRGFGLGLHAAAAIQLTRRGRSAYATTVVFKQTHAARLTLMYPWRFPQRFRSICGSRLVLTRPRQYRSEMDTKNVVYGSRARLNFGPFKMNSSSRYPNPTPLN